MDLSRLPIWAVYLFAPMLILVVCSKAIFDSNNPSLLAGALVLFGLFLAGVVHGGILLKGWVQRSLR